jgi:mannosyltransferase OCH1-like enzyme
MIPKCVFQTYHSRTLPSALAENVQQLRSLNPDWEYTLFDDSDIEGFIQTEYGTSMLRTYLRIDPSYGACRADFFRYLLMYRRGGVYLDIKSRARQTLSSVLRPDDHYILSRWRNQAGEPFAGWGQHPALHHLPGGEWQQWHIMAAPGHAYLKTVIEQVLQRIRRYHPLIQGTGKNGVLWLTGPIPYTLAIEAVRDQHLHRVVDIDADFGVDYSVLGASQTAHQGLFKSHYSQQTRPVIEQGPLGRAATPVIAALQAVKRSLRRA